jgi:glutamate-1-semialdehyde aminotransferase
MTLAEIATVTGKGGLFKVLAPTKSGVILESLDESKTKMVATTNHRLSLLNEISIYTTTKEGTVQLEDVLKKIHKEYGNDLGVDGNSDSSELKSFLKSILPEFDEARVYTSDIKKLVKWYDVILKYAPEVILTEAKPAGEKVKAEAEKSEPEKTEAEEKKAEKKPAKKTTPKAKE